MPDDDKNVLEGIFGEGAQGEALTDNTEGERAVTQEPEPKQPEKLWAGKFKSPEEMEKAYEEAQRWGTQRSQEVANIRRELEELRKSVAPDMSKQKQKEWDDHVKQAIQQAVVDDNPALLVQLIDYMIDQRTEAKLQARDAELAPLREQQRFQAEVNQFVADNPEASEYLDEITKLIQAQPDVVTRPNWLGRAYGKVLNQRLKAGTANAAKTQAEKLAAGVPGSGARGRTDTKTEDEKVLDSIFGDLSQKRKIFDD
jgi:hypothetical protein